MYTHSFRAALAAAAILLPLRATAEIAAGTEALPTPAYVVVDRILAERERLSLGSRQMAELAELAERLRADRARLKLVGLDGVPGKSVPRNTRAFPTADEALRQALGLLTPEQRRETTLLLQAETATGPHRKGDNR